ncbi:MAG: hypothetical protein R2762_28035 [Bryobacteraceae bacterium]
MRPIAWVVLFLAIAAVRFTQLDVLWVEESYPAAAAIQVLHGKVPYRDFVYDKPPLSIAFYLLFGAYAGWPLRLAGSLYVLLCAWLASRMAQRLWNPATGSLAAILTAFALTFYFPSAAMALSPDLLMIAPHFAAMAAAASGRPLAAGLFSGLAFHVHTKAIFVVAACLLWGSPIRVLAGFALAGIPPLVLLHGYWEQVWVWGFRYSRDTFVAEPVRYGLARTASWLGFHAAFAIAAALYWWRERTTDARRLLGWFLLSLAAVCAGWRFFPRYFFQAIPPLSIAAARGMGRTSLLIALLLAIPLVRFGSRYARGTADWSDLAMGRDADAASRIVMDKAMAGDTILVWGYRPEILVRTRLAAGTPYLDSQALTGILADRHLSSNEPTFPEEAKKNRAALTSLRPVFVVDGLGEYNKALAIEAFPDLAEWLGSYRAVGRTAGCVIYKLR